MSSRPELNPARPVAALSDNPNDEPSFSDAEAAPRTSPVENDTFADGADEETLRATPPVAPPGIKPVRRRFPDISGYEIEEVIGRGGMGVVYRARDLKLDRSVAVKTLQIANTGKEARQRIEHEAKLLAQVQHPGVVQIFGFGTAADPESTEPLPYIAMELVNGPNLDKYNQGNPLKPRQAAMIVYELARALAACHERGIIHRDLKPGNVLMAGENEPKLTDFGLARATGAQSRMTRTGEVMGTPGFMAPEQASGAVRNIGPPADIYGLGAILYALLTGRPPFMAPDPMQTMIEVLTRPPVAPSAIQSKIPRDLETITLKCLEKKPRHRYESCKELADDLKAYLSSKPVSARPTPAIRKAAMWVRRHPAWTSLIGLAVFAVIIGIAGTAFHINSLQTELDRSQRIIDEGRKFSKWWLEDFTNTLEGTGGVTWSRSVLADRTQTYLETLLREAPENNDLKSDLAYAFWRLADVQAAIGGGNFGTNNSSQLNMERAEQIILSLKDRETPIARKVLAAVNLHHAQVHLNKREYEEMEQRIEEVRGLISHQETLSAVDRLAFEGQISHLLFESQILRSDLAAAAKTWSELDEICKKVIANGEKPAMSVAAVSNFVFASEKLLEPQLRRKELADILDQAIRHLNEIKEKHPLINIDKALAAIELRSGNTQYWLEDFESAIEAYQAAIEINRRLALRDSMNDNIPFNTALAWQYLGDTHTMLNDLTAAETAYAEAEKQFRKWSTTSKSALEIEPAWHLFNASYGQLFMSQGKHDRAIQMFQAQVDGLGKLDKKDSLVLNSMGDALLMLAQCKAIAATSLPPETARDEVVEAINDALTAAQTAVEHFRKMESDGKMADASRQKATQADSLVQLLKKALDEIDSVPESNDL